MTPALRYRPILLFFVLSVVLIVQLISIRRPFFGHYATYQGTVMASIARNMMRENFSEILLPKTDILIAGKKSLHLNQYPFPSLIAALGAKFLGGPLEFWGRFQAILFNLSAIFLLGMIAFHLGKKDLVMPSMVLFSLSPYTLIYGQSFMSEPLSLCLLLAALYLLLAKPARWQIVFLSAFFYSLSITGRIHFFFFFPLFWFCLLSQKPSEKGPALVFFTLVSCLLPFFWYAYTYYVSVREPNVHTTLFAQILTREGKPKSLLLDPNYYRYIFDIFSRNMLTPLFFTFPFLGLWLMPKKDRSFLFILGGVILGFSPIFLAPEKVIRHDFYLYGGFPFWVLAASYGLRQVLRATPLLKGPKTVYFFLIFYLLVSCRYFLHPIFKYPEEDQKILLASGFARSHSKQEDIFIVAGMNPGILSYYIDRPHRPMALESVGKGLASYQRHLGSGDPKGFQELEAAMQDPISWFEYLRKQGAHYFLCDAKSLENTPKLFSYLRRHYPSIPVPHADFYLYEVSRP